MIELGGGLLENPKYPDKTGRRINLMAKNDNRVMMLGPENRILKGEVSLYC
jgi:hypothetical protein